MRKPPSSPLRKGIADKVAVHEVLHSEDHPGTVVHGEGGKTYWGKIGNVGAECLANYDGSAVANPVEYEVIKELFPETATTLDEPLEAMSNDIERAE